MTTFQELTYWNKNSYGKAVRVKKMHLRMAFIVGCLVTPGTNWALAFVNKIIKQDMVLRYGQ
jgi:hypothetical protein